MGEHVYHGSAAGVLVQNVPPRLILGAGRNQGHFTTQPRAIDVTIDKAIKTGADRIRVILEANGFALTENTGVSHLQLEAIRGNP